MAPNVHQRQKKLRGMPRRMRSLRKWPEQCSGYFPERDEFAESPQYWNWKIPTHCGLLEGKYTNHGIQRESAQILINACAAMIAAKPEWAASYRVTCVVCLPDMFTSEICIYVQEAYFQSHTAPTRNSGGFSDVITGRSLAQEWGLLIPQGMGELGVALDYRGYEDKDNWFIGERWYFGEVDSRESAISSNQGQTTLNQRRPYR